MKKRPHICPLSAKRQGQMCNFEQVCDCFKLLNNHLFDNLIFKSTSKHSSNLIV